MLPSGECNHTNVVFLAIGVVLDVTRSVAAEVHAGQTRVKTRPILTTRVTDRRLGLTANTTNTYIGDT